MKNNGTLDGVTAGLIAAIANGLDRYISPERMKELIGNPDKLRLLLLPIINDSWLPILSAHVTNPCFRFFGMDMEGVIPFRQTSRPTKFNKPPSMRMVFQEAYERKLAPLSWDKAKHLVEIVSVMTTPVSLNVVSPFIYRGKLEMHYFNGSSGATGWNQDVELDKTDEGVFHKIFFFEKGHEDRSNCFAC